ncbi:hypothetical protein H5410_047261 [Solanum commersonii]|uniref:Uncharacterized protein n=1 Tax=Solanum commersonii TaxID=4109 RepID=A0A9J5XEM3_SOLCO|nr:hypothetical protein H5410_047261 [Solanum commersonii]
MINLAMLLYFNGQWDSSNKYINYLVDVNLEINFAFVPLLCPDTSKDMKVIHNSYFSNTFNDIGDAIELIDFGSCEEVDELEEL